MQKERKNLWIPRRGIGCVALGLGLLLAASAPGNAAEVRLLVYNTHGLPALIAGDDPETRFPEIGAHTERYDLSLLQEDFAHHEELVSGLRTGRAQRGNPSRMPWCALCSGSGLTIISRLPNDWELSIESHAYETCSGWLGGANDCLATKGFQIARVRTPAGAVFHIVNTHLDAGGDGEDRRARLTQLGHIARVVNQTLHGEALIVAGDLNLDAANADDRRLFDAFLRDLSLRDSGARARAGSDWEILDYILYRSGKGAALEVLAADEDAALTNEAGPLSDHPALFAVFDVEPPAP